MEFSQFWFHVHVLLILLCLDASLARKRLLKVGLLYSTDGSLDGLGCAIHDPYTYNAARFNVVTKTCTQLHLASDSLLPDNNYFQLLELEVLDSQGVEKSELFPAILLPFGGVILYVTTTDNPAGQNSYGVEFLDGLTTTFVEVPRSERCFASEIKPYVCTTLSLVNHYTDYKLKYRITPSGVRMYTNDVYDFDFETGYSVERYRSLKVIQGYGIVCNRIIFFYM